MQGRIFDLFVQDERSVNPLSGRHASAWPVRILSRCMPAPLKRERRAREGKRFQVRLPVTPGVSLRPPLADLTPAEAGAGRIWWSMTISAPGNSLAMVLRLYGYEVEFASDEEAALRLARQTAAKRGASRPGDAEGGWLCHGAAPARPAGEWRKHGPISPSAVWASRKITTQ